MLMIFKYLQLLASIAAESSDSMIEIDKIVNLFMVNYHLKIMPILLQMANLNPS
jgi:hypothetical protein